VANPIIHRRKFFNGELTPQQLHAELAWHKRKCGGCGGPPAMRIQSFVLLSDLQPEARVVVDCEIALNRLHTTKMEDGPAIRIGDLFACSMCSPAAERAAAKAPSYAIVWIEKGPGPDTTTVSVVA
jgi:hypothetical protein